MRRVIGIVMMLGGAYALFWAWQGAAGHWPTNYSFTNPIVQYGVCGAAVFMVGYSIFHSYKPPVKKSVVCPNCNKLLEKGRRNCPHCNEQLVHY
jgi:hypothetical protein